MNRKILGNILIVTFIILIGSGIIMYFFPFEKRVASLHTFFALLFMLGMIFHLINNKRPLFNYITGKKETIVKKFLAPIIFTIIILAAVGVYFDFPFLNSLYNFGNELRNSQLGIKEESFEYKIINLDKTVGDQEISIELKKGDSFQYPLFAVWLEDSSGNYIETLYISKVMSSSKFKYGKKIGDKWESAIVRRPEALPYWSHQRGIKASDGLYIPLESSPDLDAVSGATPTGSFLINSKTNLDSNKSYKILLEVNQSFDWNDFYTKEKFPDDKIYSGSGKVGQPSLIYSAEINLFNKTDKTHKIMQLAGYGHYSGQDGNLYTDLTNITTAQNIADRIIVTVETKM